MDPANAAEVGSLTRRDLRLGYLALGEICSVR